MLQHVLKLFRYCFIIFSKGVPVILLSVATNSNFNIVLLRQTPVKQTVRVALNYVNLLTVFTMN